MRTCVDLINDFLRCLFVEIIYYYVRAARTVEQRVPKGEMLFDQRHHRGK
jgi:hypothetical protein